MKKFLIVIGVLLVGFILIQFIPYGHDHTNPAVVSEPAWPDTETKAIAVAACYDCHSNETVWPWYSNIAPVSWLVAHDVQEGRQHLNFSEWENSPYVVNEVTNMVSSGEMPPSYYAMMHTGAQLTDAQRQALIDGLNAAVNSTP